MDKAIKILTAVGAIIGGIGELLRQFNLASENVKSTIAEQAKELVPQELEDREKEYYKGHTQNYILVKYKTAEELENTIKTVKVFTADVEYVES